MEAVRQGVTRDGWSNTSDPGATRPGPADANSQHPTVCAPSDWVPAPQPQPQPTDSPPEWSCSISPASDITMPVQRHATSQPVQEGWVTTSPPGGYAISVASLRALVSTPSEAGNKQCMCRMIWVASDLCSTDGMASDPFLLSRDHAHQSIKKHMHCALRREKHCLWVHSIHGNRGRGPWRGVGKAQRSTHT